MLTLYFFFFLLLTHSLTYCVLFRFMFVFKQEMDDVRLFPKDIDPGDIWEKMALLRERNTWRLYALCVKSNKHAKFTNLKISRRFFFLYAFSHCLSWKRFVFETRQLHNFFNFEDIWFEVMIWKKKKKEWTQGWRKWFCMLSLYLLWKGLFMHCISWQQPDHSR